MVRFLFAFILMAATSLVWPTLPSISSLVCVFMVGLGCLYKRWFGLAGLACGLVFMAAHASYYQYLLNQLNRAGANLSIKVEVMAVVPMPRWDKLTLKLLSLPSVTILPIAQPQVQLYFNKQHKEYRTLRVGERLELQARLKPAYGSTNRHAFNYVRWLLANNYVAKGSVQGLSTPFKGSQLREEYWQRLRTELQAFDYGGEILALATGDKSLLQAERRQRYQDLGLSHLLVVSGLHLGIVASWAWACGFILSLALPSLRRYVPMLSCVIAAAAYAWLSAWGLPAQRALLMLSVAVIMPLFGLKCRPWQVLIVAMFAVILCWPFSLYSNSFWLSFMAVAVIMLCLWLGPKAWWQRLLLIQFAIASLMLPLQLLLFGSVSYSAWWLNLLLVPLFSVLVMPLVALATLSSLLLNSTPQTIWQLVDILFAWISRLLQWVSEQQVLAPSSQSIVLAMVLMLFVATILLSLCKSRLQGYGLLMLSCLGITVIPQWQAQDDWQIIVFDVGQGQAVAVRQGREVLLYDSGAKYRSGFSFAQAVIIPYLEAEALLVTHLVFSHGDNDHAGGRHILEQRYPQAQRFYGQDQRLPPANCSGSINWGDLRLHFFALASAKANDGSCTLLVTSDWHRALFVGDIEAAAEAQLSRRLTVPVDILLSPHHGSKTSSSLAFIEAAQPQVVIHSVGAYNRYGFPHPQTVQRYASSQQLRTDQSGMLTIRFREGDYQLHEFRQHALSPWYFKLIYW